MAGANEVNPERVPLVELFSNLKTSKASRPLTAFERISNKSPTSKLLFLEMPVKISMVDVK